LGIVQDKEMRINARGLSNPGPRLMAESAVAKGGFERMRVVVSSVEALEDLQAYFSSIGVTTESDQIGNDYHILADVTSHNKS
jgi:hypothetical protein